MSAKALIPPTVIASTSHYEYIEGNVYFPPNSIPDFSNTFTPSARTTQCPWKGQAQYYDINANGTVVKDAAWSYPEPLPKAEKIRGFVAFDKGKVQVEKDDAGSDGKMHGGMHMMDKVKNMFKS